MYIHSVSKCDLEYLKSISGTDDVPPGHIADQNVRQLVPCSITRSWIYLQETAPSSLRETLITRACTSDIFLLYGILMPVSCVRQPHNYLISHSGTQEWCNMHNCPDHRSVIWLSRISSSLGVCARACKNFIIAGLTSACQLSGSWTAKM